MFARIIDRLRGWYRATGRHHRTVDDPYAAAQRLARRQLAIRRTLAQVRAERTPASR